MLGAVVAGILMAGGLTGAIFGGSIKDVVEWAWPGQGATASQELAPACENPHDIDNAFQEYAFVPLENPPMYPNLRVELKGCGPGDARVVDETTIRSGETPLLYALGLANKGRTPALNVHVDFNLAPGIDLVPGSVRLYSPRQDTSTPLTDEVTADRCRRCAVNIGVIRPLDRAYILLRATVPDDRDTQWVRTGAWAYYDGDPRGANDTLRTSVLRSG